MADGLRPVLLHIDGLNIAGRRAYARAGFRECGRIRGATTVTRRRHDRIAMDGVASDCEHPRPRAILEPDPE